MPNPAADDNGDFGLAWYGAALIVYIVTGYVLQSVVLNWFVGPLFLLAVLYVIPTVGRTLVALIRAA